MDIINKLLPDSAFLQLTGWQIDDANARITLALHSTQPIAACPLCQQPSGHIHSHYKRTLADLPWADYGVQLQLRVRKFFCRNGHCEREVFTERLRNVMASWARRTQRQATRLTRLGLALGGAAGARLSQCLRIGVSRNTLLKLVRQAAQPAVTTPRILGVDDFAFRKRHTYGTILLDQEKSRPVALLKNRKAQTLAQWLKDHPGIEVITRDRANAYAEGARLGAPSATQVADRFHLLQNLAETLEQVFADHSQAIEAINEVNRQAPVILADGAEALPIPPPPSSTKANTRAEQRRAARRTRFEQVWALHQQGWRNNAIARHLGIGQRTVIRILRSEHFTERQARSDRGRSLLDPYKAYVRERWNVGCRNATRLLQEIKDRGYPGSYATLASYTRRFRRAQQQTDSSVPSDSAAKVAEPIQHPLTTRSATWLVMRRPERREVEHEQTIAQLKAQHAELAEAIELVEDFAELVRKRCPEQLDPWLVRAASSSLAPFRGFAKGLQSDYDAVKAGVTLAWSNGPVEGHINRLKMIKRTMFGRAKLDLLSQRFLPAA